MYLNKNSNGKIRKDLFVWGFVLIVMPLLVAGRGIAVGDVEQGGAEAGANESIGAEDASTGEVKLAVNLTKDMDIRSALAMLAGMYEKNIVPTPNVDGQLAFRSLRNVTFEEAMDAILGESFKYEQKGNLIKVYTKEEYKAIMTDKGRRIHKVFSLYYISAADARKLVSPILSNNGVVEATTASITGVPTGESISTGKGGGDTMSLQDALLIYDYPENIAKAEDVITSIDVRPKQVLVEATILSATLDENMQFGIDWSTLHGVVSQVPGVTAAAGDITRGASDFFKSAGTSQVTRSGGMSVGLAVDNVAAFIKAVEKVTDITILANPKILAVNKQLGQVYIGNKIGYVSQTTQIDTSTTQAVEFLDTGTKLSFRPYISGEGYIRMDIHAKDSTGTLKDNDIPDESSAELVTNIMVKDGGTIVIGGLFRDKITNGRTQIPLLGDIPIIGVAFRGTSDKVERQEVIVLLTVHIIEEPEETNGDARAEDIARKRYGARKEQQWIGRARLAEDSYARAAKYYLEGNTKAAMRELKVSLELRPAYLEALRLKEKIISETNPQVIAEPSQAERKTEANGIRHKRFGARGVLQRVDRARLAEERYAKATEYYIEGETEAAMKEVKSALELRPTYLDAIRLKEKIISETALDDVAMIE